VLTKRLAFASDVAPSLVRFASRMLAQTPIDVVAEFFRRSTRTTSWPRCRCAAGGTWSWSAPKTC
jgi:hypothetical protein